MNFHIGSTQTVVLLPKHYITLCDINNNFISGTILLHYINKCYCTLFTMTLGFYVGPWGSIVVKALRY